MDVVIKGRVGSAGVRLLLLGYVNAHLITFSLAWKTHKSMLLTTADGMNAFIILSATQFSLALTHVIHPPAAWRELPSASLKPPLFPLPVTSLHTAATQA